MGKIRPPDRVMLFAGLLYCAGEEQKQEQNQNQKQNQKQLSAAINALTGAFGPLLLETGPSPWHSVYYANELGCTGVKRKFLFFERLICPGLLADIKLGTNGMESALSEGGQRKINIDPGYITPARIVLASTKDYAHRVYLQKGIYAEVTMLWSRKERTFMPHLFTYTDFRDDTNIKVFSEMREWLQAQLAAPLPLQDCE